ncbi:MAG TPA: hypothetical protein VKA95_08240 [Nitrososphaeraceae archaeon]|nr:hypothetical protein [Nitrososphaeraceae archaeon]
MYEGSVDQRASLKVKHLAKYNNNTKVNGTVEAWMDAGVRVQ